MEINELLLWIQDENNAKIQELDEATARFAANIAWMDVESIDEAFLFFASMNYLNAYVKINDANNSMYKRYDFKRDVVGVLEGCVLRPIESMNIYIDSDVTYVELVGLQFSFHHLPKSAVLQEYQKGETNRSIEWKGIRLQPFAKEILETAIDSASPALRRRIQPIDLPTTFSRLGHPIRLRMFLALLQQESNREELATLCDIALSKANYHIRILIGIRLIEGRRIQKTMVYRVNPIALGQLSSLIPHHPRRLKPVA